MDRIYLPEGLTRSERTEKLNKSMRGTKTCICVERARLVTESYKMTEGQPVILRRAKALAYILKNMTIFIGDDELIVGNHASHQRWAPMFPDLFAFSKEELDYCPVRNVDTLCIPEEDKAYLMNDIYPYWKGKNLSDISHSYFPKDILELLSKDIKVFDPLSRLKSGYGHYVANFRKIINSGFVQVETEAEFYLKNLDELDPDYSEKMLFYQSVIIICQAIEEYASRFHQLALKLAGSESDPRRKKELQLIAGACACVPYNPATNFHEALQSYYFTILIDYIFQNGSAISAGRFDQYIYPFYIRDINEGRISKDEAQEFIEALFVKHSDIIKAGTYGSVKNNGGFATTIHLSISGVDENGKDATNELSYMVLDADRNVFNSEPNIGVKVSTDCPDRLIEKLIETLVVKEGGKYPIFNDRAISQALMDQDAVSEKDARDFCVVGCVEPTPSDSCMGITNACFFNVAKCLELALNNGVCMLTNEQLGPETGDPKTFNTFQQVLDAFEEQLTYFADKTILTLNIITKVISIYAPHIYCSLILDDCLEKGLDAAAGGARYNFIGVQAVGVIDTADSLVALNELVYKKKEISMSELVEALKNNFSNDEILRQKLINRVPKFGNDILEPDEMARYVAEKYCMKMKRGKDFRGGNYRAGLYCLSSNTPFGQQTAALPSGRPAKTPLEDGGVSPKHGMDMNGPTAAIKSIARINHSLATNGTNYNQKYLPALLKNAKSRKHLVEIIKAYFALDGFQIQFNVVSPETLKKAQLNPEEYRGLVVRVAGYSAFFVELDKDIQDEIISRTENVSF